MTTLGYLGPAGSHSHLAVDTLLSQGVLTAPVSALPFPGFTAILSALEDGSLDLACLPVENAIEGAVNEVLDTLALKAQHTRIVAEFVRPIQHALIRQYSTLNGIRFIHSHPQALGQCRDTLETLLGPEIKYLAATSTSDAVKALVGMDETHAAIGTVQAASHYGFDVVVDNISSQDNNATRFLLLSHSAFEADALVNVTLAGGQMKSSLAISVAVDKPGALLELLSVLAEAQLNMSKIESRPSKTMLGRYVFYIDIEGVVPEVVYQRLESQARFFKRIGVYPVLGVLEASSTVAPL